jgi:hypothetical protein
LLAVERLQQHGKKQHHNITATYQSYVASHIDKIFIDNHDNVRTAMADLRVVEALKETWIFKPTGVDGSTYR